MDILKLQDSNQGPITYLMEIAKKILYWELFTEGVSIQSVL